MDSDDDSCRSSDEEGTTTLCGAASRVPRKKRSLLSHLHLQPHRDASEQDACKMFQEISYNLSQVVLCHDLKVGTVFWIQQLDRYMDAYGRCLEKSDRISLIKLVYEIICIPGLDWSLIMQFSSSLVQLISIREITRAELELPWRPFQRLYDYVFHNALAKDSLLHLPDGAGRSVKRLIRKCRVYFPDSSTQEMLDEWLPMACPFKYVMRVVAKKLNLFLPTSLEPKTGYKLWFDDVMNMYLSATSAPRWRKPITKLLCRLAASYIGHIDWEPHLPLICTRILNAFNVPVGSDRLQTFEVNASNTPLMQCAMWLVAAITPTNSVIDHIERMLTVLLPFFHPSNGGSWSKKLITFIDDLAVCICERVHIERFKKKSTFIHWTDDSKLTDGQIEKLVLILKPVALTALFNETNERSVCLTLQHLTNLRPDLVFPDLIDCLLEAFDSLTEPYRLQATLTSALFTTRTLNSAPSLGPGYHRGRAQVIRILQLSLPGIDPNDIPKTVSVLQLVYEYSSLVPFVDCSEALHLRSDLTEEEKELCSLSAHFEDFVISFLDRLFYLIEACSLSHLESATATSSRSSEDNLLKSSICLSLNQVLSQCSNNIFKSAFHKLYMFLTTNTFVIVSADHLAAAVASAVCEVDGEAGGKLLSAALDHLLQFTEVDVQDEEELDCVLLWWLQLLVPCMLCDGAELVKRKDPLLSVLGRILGMVHTDGGTLVTRALNHCLFSLTVVHPYDCRCSENDWDLPLTESLPIRDWGRLYTPEEMTINWHIPSPEEISMAEDIVALVLDTVQTPLTSFISGDGVAEGSKPAVSRKKMEQMVAVLDATVAGAHAVLPQCESTHVPLDGRRLHSTVIRDGGLSVKYRGKCVREHIIDLLRPLVVHFLSDLSESVRLLRYSCSVYGKVLFFHGVKDLDKDSPTFSSITGTTLWNPRKKVRRVQIEKAMKLYKLRMRCSYPRDYTEFVRDALKDALALATSRYTCVQSYGRDILLEAFRVYPGSIGPLMGEMVSLLKKDDSISDNQLEGVLEVIYGTSSVYEPCRTTEWSHRKSLALALLQCSHSEELHIQACVRYILGKMVGNIETVAFSHNITPACRDAALSLMRASGKGEPDPILIQISLIEKEERERGWAREYDEFVESLMQLLSENTLIWSHANYALDLLRHMVRWDKTTKTETATVFMDALISTSYNRRRGVRTVIMSMLCQEKPPRIKRAVNPLLVTSADPVTSASDSLTSGPVTSNPVTSDLVTSDLVTSASLTSGHVTSNPVTSNPVTSNPVMSDPLTSGSVTSASVTSASVTCASLTSDPLTSKERKSPASLPSWAASEACGALRTEYTGGGNSRTDVPGMRENNMWLQYDKDCLPRTADQWDDTLFVEKAHWGFYKWPRELIVYAPPSCQPPYERALPGSPGEATLGPAETVILKALKNPGYIKQLFQYLSMADPGDDHTGDGNTETFEWRSCQMFKCFVRNFGPSLIPVFTEALEGLAEDSTPETHSSRQRCMAEVVSGMLMGSKHWPFTEVMRLWEWVLPFLEKVLALAGPDDTKTWVSAFIYISCDRDPRKLWPLMEWLLKEFEALTLSSANSKVWTLLRYMETVFSVHKWRVASIHKRVLGILQSGPWMNHPFKVVQYQVSSFLSTGFQGEFNFSVNHSGNNNNDGDDTTDDRLKAIESGNSEVMKYTGPTRADLVEHLIHHLSPSIKSPAPTSSEKAGFQITLPHANHTGDTSVNEPLLSNDSCVPPMSTNEPLISCTCVQSQGQTVQTAALALQPRKCQGTSKVKVKTQNTAVGDIKGKLLNGSDEDGSVAMITKGIASVSLEEDNNAKQYLKLALCWLDENFRTSRNCQEWTSEIMKLVPLVLSLTSDQSDIDLQQLSLCVTYGLSLSELPRWILSDWMRAIGGNELMEQEGKSEDMARKSGISEAKVATLRGAAEKRDVDGERRGLEGEKGMAGLASWHTRYLLLEHVQITLFKNIFVMEGAGFRQPLKRMMLRLLEDDQVEVRTLASVTLSGALQCGFISMDTELVRHCCNLARTKLPKQGVRSASASGVSGSVITRHAGVLGMCACVSAYPYTIPECMPAILMSLTEHIHDPQPIQETVTMTLSKFKHTHLDQWTEHQKAFTSDQLLTLSDLLVSPSYYA